MKFDWYTRTYLWLVAQRRWVLTAVILTVAIGTLISTRIDLEEDILATLPQGDTLVDEYRYAVKKFRQIDRVYIDVSVNTDDSDTLASAADQVYARLATNAAYEHFMYRIEMTGQNKVIDFFTSALPNLFTEADVQALAPKLEPSSVREYLAVMRRKLSGPEGMVLKDIVAADPIGMSGLMAAKVLPLQTGFSDSQIVDGRIVSKDGRHVLILAEPKFPSLNSRESTVLVDDLLQLAREAEKQFPGVHVAITGGHRMTVDNATLIKGDATRCIFLGMGAMLVLCLTAFRRRWLATVAFLPSFFGTLMAAVVLALWQKHLSAIATGFATIAIGITVDYAIYVIYHLDNAAGLDRESVGKHVGRLAIPISLGALTTIAAFAVMATSPMRGYQQLGLFGAIGVLISAAFALFILPLLVPIPKQTNQPPLWLTRFMDRFHIWQIRARPWLLLAMLTLTIVTAFGIKRLRFEGDIAKLNGITEGTRRDEASIRQTWGDALGMTLVVARGKTVEEALQQNDRTTEILNRDPAVKAVYSLSSVCPSRATQETNIQRWKTFWTMERRTALRQTLDKVGAELGFRPDAFTGFWKRIENDPPFLTPDSFRGTPLEQALNERVAFADQRVTEILPATRQQNAGGTPNDNAISTLVRLDDRSQAERLRRALPETIVLDRVDFVEHIARLARSGLGHFALWTALIVGALLFISHASIELVGAVLLPLAFSLLWTFGLMGWIGLPIDLMNSVFVIFIIGVGEDYGVFLMTSKLDEWHGYPQRINATSASVLISALTTLFGFAVLIFARHPVLFSMGTTVLLGMACAFAATLILTPLCMDLLLWRPQPTGGPKWWHLFGTVWVTVHLGGSQVFLYYILRPLLKIFSRRNADDQLRRATRWMARGVVKGLPFGRLEFRNITKETFAPPSIVISNHQSAVDVMLMVSLPGDVRQTAKKRVFDNPALGIGCKLLGHVMVEPKDPEITLRRCREKLAKGASVHFYPEGTRSHDGFVQRFHRGAFELAVELEQEIRPIVLCDTWTAMPRDAFWFEPYNVTVTALPRVTPQNFDYSLGAQALMKHCEIILRRAFQQQLDELNTPRVLRRKVQRLYRHQGISIEQFVYWKLKLDPMFPVLDSVVPRRGLILDLGCGYGVPTHWLAHTTDERRFLAVDYDEDKIRVARQTAQRSERIQFGVQDLLEWEYPPCDAVLLLDVLHYWTPEKQQLILDKARGALRPGGTLVLREAAYAQDEAHRRVARWEKIATRIGHNKTKEGLHFQTLVQLQEALRRAGFKRWELKPEAKRDSNVLLVASVES